MVDDYYKPGPIYWFQSGYMPLPPLPASHWQFSLEFDPWAALAEREKAFNARLAALEEEIRQLKEKLP